jgi:hypothetical protein
MPVDCSDGLGSIDIKCGADFSGKAYAGFNSGNTRNVAYFFYSYSTQPLTVSKILFTDFHSHATT